MQMEIQMKAICAGTTTKEAVVQRNINQFREVYHRTHQELNVLKTVSSYWS